VNIQNSDVLIAFNVPNHLVMVIVVLVYTNEMQPLFLTLLLALTHTTFVFIKVTHILAVN
jgi:hypothetical protein